MLWCPRCRGLKWPWAKTCSACAAVSMSGEHKDEGAEAVPCQECGEPNHPDDLYCRACSAMLDAEWEDGDYDDGG